MPDTILQLPETRFTWRLAWGNANYRIQFVLAFSFLLALAVFFPFYFDYLEARNGAVLRDFILDYIPATDVSWLTFIFLYAGILTGIGCNLFRPVNMLIALQSYVLVMLMRVVSLYFVHLDPPVGYIELKDPFISMLFTTNGTNCSRDLFFSGHVSTLLVIFLSVQQKVPKTVILFFALIVGGLVLVQHAHYTIDVVVAPAAAYFCHNISKNVFLKKLKGEIIRP